MRNLFFTLSIVCMLFLCAPITFASVIINEIAWMGTLTSANHEWIELYNSGTEEISVDGWTLNALDGSPNIDLIGAISAGGYYLAERTSDATVPDVTAGVIYTGSLSNTGETLILKNQLDETIDTVAMSGGWAGGDNTTKYTLQKYEGNWVTASPTPGLPNNPGTTGSGNSGSGTGSTNTGSGSSSSSNTGTTTGTNTTSSKPPPKEKTEKEYWQEYVQQLDPDPRYSARMIVPDVVVQHVPVKLSATVKKFDILTMLEGRYEWSMGDGQSYLFRQNTPIIYSYQQPGKYTVIMNYYSNSFKEEPDSIHQKTITVIPALVDISADPITGVITLTNTSTGNIDLHQWKLESSVGNSFIFSTSVIIPENESVPIPQSVHKLSYPTTDTLQLFTPDGYRIQKKTSQISKPIASVSKTSANISIEPLDQLGIENSETLYQRPQTVQVTPFTQSTGAQIPITLFIIGSIFATAGFHRIARYSDESESLPQKPSV